MSILLHNKLYHSAHKKAICGAKKEHYIINTF